MTRLRTFVVVVGLVTFAWSTLALDARATFQTRTTADEPQYLLTALSLWEDRSLEITDELAEERFHPFHEVALPVQTEAVDDSGRLLSPHDPLLPLVLAVPMGLGGWVGAKLALAALAGVLAGLLLWVAARRLRVPEGVAALVVLAFSVSAPLSAYATQVYPELPAALAVTAAIAALTGPFGRTGRWAAGLAVVALPWLGVKYIAVAAVLGAIALVRVARERDTRATLSFLAGLAGAGVVYLVAHRAWYGGWTVYAAGDHFVDGELSVVGFEPDHVGRSRRLVALLLDRGFGLAAWAPVYLLAVPALAALVRRRPPGWGVLIGPLAAGWATATWVALTMHGWWWPGRQVVVVLPLAVLAIAWWAAQVRAVATVAAVLGVVGAAGWLWLLVDVAVLGDLRLIIDFGHTSNPVSRAWRLALPELRTPLAGDWLRYAAWLAAAAVAAVAGWRSVPRPRSHPHPERTTDAVPVIASHV